MTHQTSQMPRNSYNIIDVIEIISSGIYDNIVLLDQGDHLPLDAISYIIKNCRMCHRFQLKSFKPGMLNVW